MAFRLFSDDQLEALEGFPDIGKDELIRVFTLAPADVAFADPGRGRGPADRLGLAVQRCTLPWLGFVPDDVRAAPPVAVGRLAQRLRVDAAVLAGYGRTSAGPHRSSAAGHRLPVAPISPTAAFSGKGEVRITFTVARGV